MAALHAAAHTLNEGETHKMDFASEIVSRWMTATPLLPALSVQRAYLALSWGLVLAALLDTALRRWGGSAFKRYAVSDQARERVQMWGPRLVLLWCLLPFAGTPAYALGLAFQAPSGVAMLVSVTLLLRARWPQERVQRCVPDLWATLIAQAPAWAALGWLLLLDTFALWPVSLYAYGFAPITVGVLAVLALLPWMLGGRVGSSALLLLALLVFVLLRLPDGNVWTAVLDPGLWVVVQVAALWRWHSQRRRGVSA